MIGNFGFSIAVVTTFFGVLTAALGREQAKPDWLAGCTQNSRLSNHEGIKQGVKDDKGSEPTASDLAARLR